MDVDGGLHCPGRLGFAGALGSTRFCDVMLWSSAVSVGCFFLTAWRLQILQWGGESDMRREEGGREIQNLVNYE